MTLQNNNNDDNQSDISATRTIAEGTNTTPTTTAATPKFLRKIVDVTNRRFIVQTLQFDNGNFVSITEGNEKIGSMVVSLSTSSMPAATAVTTTVIPTTRNESLFIKLTAEKISSTTQGIAIVSVNVKSEIDINSAKAITNQITEMIRNV